MAVIGAPACGSPVAKRRDEPRLVGEVRKARICEANATHIIKKDKRFFLGTVGCADQNGKFFNSF